MDVRLQSHDGPVVSLGQQIEHIKDSLDQQHLLWRDRLRSNPAQFPEIETAVHRSFQQMADRAVVGLLADVGQQPLLEDTAKKSG